jgi:hypothetical protein
MKLKDEHKDFLLNETTLRQWSYLSLAQRCVLFHRQFPDIRISHSLLFRFYREHKVRYKKIRRTKFDVDYNIPKYREQLLEMKARLA